MIISSDSVCRESKKEELKAHLEYEESKAKRRFLGNIRFIGELFKLKMLTENIMHDCVFKFLRTKDPENLECLYQLLTTIGKELETDTAKPRMDQYFRQITKILNEKKTSSRVRFMLQGLIDLRKNNWGRTENIPSTADLVKQDAAREAKTRAVHNQKRPQHRKAVLKTAKRSQRNTGQPHCQVQSVTSKLVGLKHQLLSNCAAVECSVSSKKYSDATMGIQNMKTSIERELQQHIKSLETITHDVEQLDSENTRLKHEIQQLKQLKQTLQSQGRVKDTEDEYQNKQQVDESSIQLGPGGGASRFAGWGQSSAGGGASRFAGWGRESTGDGARASQEKERPSGPSNRFSALCKPEEESRRGYSFVSPARGEVRGRGGFGQPPRLTARAFQKQEREKALAAFKSMGISQSAEVTHWERSRGRKPEKEWPSPVTTSQPELSKDEIDKKTKAILDEYLHIQDMKETVTCVKELPPANHAHFCANALNHVLERSEVARRQTGHLLHDLVKNSIVAIDSYIKGLLEILEFAEDMEIDIPKIWTYLGELVGQMFQDGSVPLSFLKEAAKPLVPSNKAGIFVAAVLHDASHRVHHKILAELWQYSGLQWTDFLPKDQIDQFLVDKKLEFTKGGDIVPTTPTTGLPMVTIEEELNRLVVHEKRDNETVFDWIESNVDEPTTKGWKFIRVLMTCVCNSAFIGQGSNIRVDPKEVSKRHDLLQKYLNHQAESELQALYALQALVTKLEHPPGVFRQMFDVLYDEDIISEDAFLQWEKSDEEPRKGVAMKQVVQFFRWLREAEDDNDS